MFDPCITHHTQNPLEFLIQEGFFMSVQSEMRLSDAGWGATVTGPMLLPFNTLRS